jgi:hypothetical protein
LNVFSLFLAFFVLRHGVTVPFDHTVNAWYAGIYLQPRSLERFYTSLVVMWLCLLAGVWLGRATFGSGVLNARAFHAEMTSRPIRPGMSQPLFLTALAVAVGLVWVYQMGFDVSLTQLLSGGLTAIDYRAMRNSFGSSTHWSAGVGERLASIARFGLFPFFRTHCRAVVRTENGIRVSADRPRRGRISETGQAGPPIARLEDLGPRDGRVVRPDAVLVSPPIP